MRIGTYIGMFFQIKKNIQSFCTTYLRKEKLLQVLKICNMTQYYKDKNSPKNMDLNSEKQQFSDFFEDT